MRPLRVVVLNVLPHDIVEMLLAEYEEVIDALDLDRLIKTLAIGVDVGRAKRQTL